MHIICMDGKEDGVGDHKSDERTIAVLAIHTIKTGCLCQKAETWS